MQGPPCSRGQGPSFGPPSGRDHILRATVDRPNWMQNASETGISLEGQKMMYDFT